MLVKPYDDSVKAANITIVVPIVVFAIVILDLIVINQLVPYGYTI